jgi:ppGpp synthetase/RelA/SpoT-type nucleotidyltranferase
MIVPSAISRRFLELGPQLEILAEQVRDTVSRFCERCNFAYVGRIKKLESLAEKIETGRFCKWSDLDDLFGCAIVIPTLDQEDGVLEFLRGVFIEIQTKRRGSTLKSPDVFRFETTRFVGRLNPISDLEPNKPLYGVSFEVQVRSAFEHAWSVTTHA